MDQDLDEISVVSGTTNGSNNFGFENDYLYSLLPVLEQERGPSPQVAPQDCSVSDHHHNYGLRKKSPHLYYPEQFTRSHRLKKGDDEYINITKSFKDLSPPKSQRNQECIEFRCSGRNKCISQDNHSFFRRSSRIRTRNASYKEIVRENCSQKEIASKDCSQMVITSEDCIQKKIVNENCSQKEITNEDCIQKEITNEKCGRNVIASENCIQNEITSEDCSQKVIASKYCSHKVIASEDCIVKEIASEDCIQKDISSGDFSQKVITSEDCIMKKIVSEDCIHKEIASEDCNQKVIASEDCIHREIASENYSQAAKIFTDDDIIENTKGQFNCSKLNVSQKDADYIKLEKTQTKNIDSPEMLQNYDQFYVSGIVSNISSVSMLLSDSVNNCQEMKAENNLSPALKELNGVLIRNEFNTDQQSEPNTDQHIVFTSESGRSYSNQQIITISDSAICFSNQNKMSVSSPRYNFHDHYKLIGQEQGKHFPEQQIISDTGTNFPDKQMSKLGNSFPDQQVMSTPGTNFSDQQIMFTPGTNFSDQMIMSTTGTNFPDEQIMFTKGTNFPDQQIMSTSGTNFPDEQIMSTSGSNFPEQQIMSTSGTNFPDQQIMSTSGSNFPEQQIMCKSGTNFLDQQIISTSGTNFQDQPKIIVHGQRTTCPIEQTMDNLGGIICSDQQQLTISDSINDCFPLNVHADKSTYSKSKYCPTSLNKQTDAEASNEVIACDSSSIASCSTLPPSGPLERIILEEQLKPHKIATSHYVLEIEKGIHCNATDRAAKSKPSSSLSSSQESDVSCPMLNYPAVVKSHKNIQKLKDSSNSKQVWNNNCTNDLPCINTKELIQCLSQHKEVVGDVSLLKEITVSSHVLTVLPCQAASIPMCNNNPDKKNAIETIISNKEAKSMNEPNPGLIVLPQSFELQKSVTEMLEDVQQPGSGCGDVDNRKEHHTILDTYGEQTIPDATPAPDDGLNGKTEYLQCSWRTCQGQLYHENCQVSGDRVNTSAVSRKDYSHDGSLYGKTNLEVSCINKAQSKDSHLLNRLLDLYDKMLEKLDGGCVLDGRKHLDKFEEVINKLRMQLERDKTSLLSTSGRDRGKRQRNKLKEINDSEVVLAKALEKHELLKQRIMALQTDAEKKQLKKNCNADHTYFQQKNNSTVNNTYPSIGQSEITAQNIHRENNEAKTIVQDSNYLLRWKENKVNDSHTEVYVTPQKVKHVENLNNKNAFLKTTKQNYYELDQNFNLREQNLKPTTFNNHEILAYGTEIEYLKSSHKRDDLGNNEIITEGASASMKGNSVIEITSNSLCVDSCADGGNSDVTHTVQNHSTFTNYECSKINHYPHISEYSSHGNSSGNNLFYSQNNIFLNNDSLEIQEGNTDCMTVDVSTTPRYGDKTYNRNLKTVNLTNNSEVQLKDSSFAHKTTKFIENNTKILCCENIDYTNTDNHNKMDVGSSQIFQKTTSILQPQSTVYVDVSSWRPVSTAKILDQSKTVLWRGQSLLDPISDKCCLNSQPLFENPSSQNHKDFVHEPLVESGTKNYIKQGQIECINSCSTKVQIIEEKSPSGNNVLTSCTQTQPFSCLPLPKNLDDISSMNTITKSIHLTSQGMALPESYLTLQHQLTSTSLVELEENGADKVRGVMNEAEAMNSGVSSFPQSFFSRELEPHHLNKKTSENSRGIVGDEKQQIIAACQVSDCDLSRQTQSHILASESLTYTGGGQIDYKNTAVTNVQIINAERDYRAQSDSRTLTNTALADTAVQNGSIFISPNFNVKHLEYTINSNGQNSQNVVPEISLCHQSSKPELVSFNPDKGIKAVVTENLQSQNGKSLINYLPTGRQAQQNITINSSKPKMGAFCKPNQSIGIQPASPSSTISSSLFAVPSKEIVRRMGSRIISDKSHNPLQVNNPHSSATETNISKPYQKYGLQTTRINNLANQTLEAKNQVFCGKSNTDQATCTDISHNSGTNKVFLQTDVIPPGSHTNIVLPGQKKRRQPKKLKCTDTGMKKTKYSQNVPAQEKIENYRSSNNTYIMQANKPIDPKNNCTETILDNTQTISKINFIKANLDNIQPPSEKSCTNDNLDNVHRMSKNNCTPAYIDNIQQKANKNSCAKDKLDNFKQMSVFPETCLTASDTIDESFLIRNLRAVRMIADEEVIDTSNDFPPDFWNEDFLNIKISESLWNILDVW